MFGYKRYCTLFYSILQGISSVHAPHFAKTNSPPGTPILYYFKKISSYLYKLLKNPAS